MASFPDWIGFFLQIRDLVYHLFFIKKDECLNNPKQPDTSREKMEFQSEDKRQRGLIQHVPYQEEQHVGASWHFHNNDNDVNWQETQDKS